MTKPSSLVCAKVRPSLDRQSECWLHALFLSLPDCRSRITSATLRHFAWRPAPVTVAVQALVFAILPIPLVSGIGGATS